MEGTIDIDSYGKELQEKSLKLTKDILVETLELREANLNQLARGPSDHLFRKVN